MNLLVEKFRDVIEQNGLETNFFKIFGAITSENVGGYLGVLFDEARNGFPKSTAICYLQAICYAYGFISLHDVEAEVRLKIED